MNEIKVILTSEGIPEKFKKNFWEFVDIKPTEFKVAFITNASDNYQKRDWAFSAKNYLLKMGSVVDDFDLRKYQGVPEKLKADLSQYNLIWTGPGDVFPLRYKMKQSGFDEVIKKLLSEGIIYGGESAGAIVAGPSLSHFIRLEDEKDTEVLATGLNLVSFIPIPHWESPEFADSEELKYVLEQLSHSPYQVIKIKENQAVMVNGPHTKIF